MRVETNQQGRTVPAPAGLVEMGPLMQVRITVLAEHAKLLKKEGRDVPSVDGHVLIDTGAGRTAIDVDVAKTLGLPVKGRAHISSASQESVIMPVYAGKLSIPGFIDIDVSTGLLGVNLRGHDHNTIALIGRDLLANAVLIYNGAEGSVSLSI